MATSAAPVEAKPTNWYAKRNYQGPEVVLRVRGVGLLTNTSEDETVNGQPVSIPKQGDWWTEASYYGVEMGGAYFLSDRFAVEGNLGYLGTTDTFVQTFTFTQGGSPVVVSTEGKVRMIPVTLLAQFYPAPYGDFVPYLGAGWQHAFIMNDYENIEMDDFSGPVFQVGADYWFNEKYAFNFELRKVWMKTDIDYSALVGQAIPGMEYKSEADLDPLLISAGLTVRF